MCCPFPFPPFFVLSSILPFYPFSFHLSFLSSLSLLSSVAVSMRNVTLMAEKVSASLRMAQTPGSIAHKRIAGQSSTTVNVMLNAIHQSVSMMLMSVCQRAAAPQSKCVCLSVCPVIKWGRKVSDNSTVHCGSAPQAHQISQL